MSATGLNDWVPLLRPELPSPQMMLPWLERMHAARQYSNFGPLVQALEFELAGHLGVATAQATTVANATLGLELVLQALDLPPGSRVLLPAFTFVATATAVLRAGHVPVLSDVDADSWMLTPSLARQACAQTHVDAVLPVAAFGMPHDMAEWQYFEQTTGLPVVVDAAAAFGSQQLNGAQGTLVFSLHTTKSLPAGEGGLIVSTKPGLAKRVRQLSNFGINLDSGSNVPIGALTLCGSNAKMSEYHAAIGLASLQTWSGQAASRRALMTDIMAALDMASGGQLRWQTQGSGGPLLAPTSLCVRLPQEAMRTQLERLCLEARITTRRWYQPLLQHMPALQQRCHTLPSPNALAISQTLIGLPFFLGMTQEQFARVEEVVGSIFTPASVSHATQGVQSLASVSLAQPGRVM
ncbi:MULTISPECIES: DegT/DnrJ/EryC1/StrS family aminotransferase [unclassified Delftia]|uniref:DegT/DnrJ/EryC1/StrS family aminotransferase n=1 Tax=unclassified Delftia TaxID=2613839 RepID=UPI0018FF88A6|nr:MULTISPECIES: DegT/DnrJ/EryC1/StrS family aminotransferase [unclassified Delftia]MBK0113608.1 DegT/DnrJ/EryC1/StrS family aminotransferase [Delftia sp. S65]MBK0120657.1 DegT/DnrJ/EryC1/StrS family aminotransferase [Delftia sp. S67]MBK0130947.1 DegT/DnrJ/EryC1/StrS family aminotransferase [Delftia sp. S66]